MSRVCRPLVVLLFICIAPLRAQGRLLVDLGAGSLSPDDPFHATLSLRGSVGWILSPRNALALDYTRQSGNRSTALDLGRYARHFVGVSWQHAFRDAFYDEERLKQQYFLNVRGGWLVRGRTRGIDPVQDLKNAPFVGVGLAIRYPLASRLAVMGTIEDDAGILPRQAIKSYCQTPSGPCYPSGGPDYYTLEPGTRVQHNFGLFVVVQWRP